MNQNLILEDEKPLTPAPKQPRDQHLIGLLASLLCLAGAIYVLWSTGNVVVFLLLIGVATDQMPIWRAIGCLSSLSGQTKPDEGETREEGLL